jgi:hypothetical protein
MDKISKLKTELSNSIDCAEERAGRAPLDAQTPSYSTKDSPLPLPFEAKTEEVKAKERETVLREDPTTVPMDNPSHSSEPISIATQTFPQSTSSDDSARSSRKAAGAAINRFLLDYLSKQQKEIDDLRKTQDTIQELLHKRDLFQDRAELASSNGAVPNDFSNEESTYTHIFVDDVVDLSAEGAELDLPSATAAASEVEVEVEVDPSQEATPSPSHSRKPSGTDSVVSSLSGCTGLSSASQTVIHYPLNHYSRTQPPKEDLPPAHHLQRLKFQSFIDMAQSYSPNFRFNKKFNYSSNFNTNNYLANRDLEEMVT